MYFSSNSRPEYRPGVQRLPSKYAVWRTISIPKASQSHLPHLYCYGLDSTVSAPCVCACIQPTTIELQYMQTLYIQTRDTAVHLSVSIYIHSHIYIHMCVCHCMYSKHLYTYSRYACTHMCNYPYICIYNIVRVCYRKNKHCYITNFQT